MSIDSTPRAGVFVTGTDTQVGKTFTAACLARWFTAAGRRVGVYKPVASGCREDHGVRTSDDAVALWEAAARPGTLAEVCPQQFLASLAPNVAAADEERTVDDELLLQGLRVWQARSDLVIVEGAGGLLSPLSDTLSNADFAAACGYPLIVVAANRLGCINHTLLTVEAACRPERGLSVALVVLNDLPDHTSDISRASNYAELARRLTVPLVRARENQLHPWPELERLVPLGGK